MQTVARVGNDVDAWTVIVQVMAVLLVALVIESRSVGKATEKRLNQFQVHLAGILGVVTWIVAYPAILLIAYGLAYISIGLLDEFSSFLLRAAILDTVLLLLIVVYRPVSAMTSSTIHHSFLAFKSYQDGRQHDQEQREIKAEQHQMRNELVRHSIEICSGFVSIFMDASAAERSLERNRSTMTPREYGELRRALDNNYERLESTFRDFQEKRFDAMARLESFGTRIMAVEAGLADQFHSRMSDISSRIAATYSHQF